MEIYSKVDKRPVWELLDVDFFQFYKNYTDEQLIECKTYLLSKVKSLIDKPVATKKQNKIEKELEKYLKENAPEKYYLYVPSKKGIRRHVFKYETLENSARVRRTNHIKREIARISGVKVNIVEDLENKTFTIKYKGTVDDEKKKYINLLKRTEYNQEYFDKTTQYFEDVALGKVIRDKVEEAYIKYDNVVKEYRKQCIKHESIIERWKRLIWVIDIELRLREHEKNNNIKISRTSFTTPSDYWNKLNFKKDKFGLINNVFLLKNNVPYRVVAVEYYSWGREKPFQYSKIYLENTDDTYESLYSLIEPDGLANTYSRLTVTKEDDANVRLLIEESPSLSNEVLNYPIKDVDFYSTGNEYSNNWEEFFTDDEEDDDFDGEIQDNQEQVDLFAELDDEIDLTQLKRS